MLIPLVTKERGSRWILFLMAIAGLLTAPSHTTAVEAKGSKGITVTPTEPSVVDEATLFSFDDVSIPFTQNLYLSMREPEKYAQNPVVPLGKIGEPDEWQQRRLAARGYQFLCFVCWRVTVSHSWAVSLRRRREV